MSAKIKDCSAKITKLSEDIDKAQHANEELRKENERLEQEMDILKYQLSGESAPELLKGQLKSQKEKIAELERLNAILSQSTEQSRGEDVGMCDLLVQLKEYVDSTFKSLQDHPIGILFFVYFDQILD
jgi:hypothetical protein